MWNLVREKLIRLLKATVLMTSEKFEKYSLVYSLSYKKNDQSLESPLR